jgi:quercetin dioxygenase-like cupin family protein
VRWIYVIDGKIDRLIGKTRLRLGAGESVFIPRKVPRGWGCVGDTPSKIINVYQPAGKMEEFFRAVGESKDLPSREQVMMKTYTEKQR